MAKVKALFSLYFCSVELRLDEGSTTFSPFSFLCLSFLKNGEIVVLAIVLLMC